MNRLSLSDLEARCQKPDHRRLGNWMARRVSRTMALRVTWAIAPYGIPAHAATCLALLIAITASACFATGATMGWFMGAALLQLWYLLDHVDGQLARLNGTSSLDGIQFDYLMHHLVNLLVPCSLGYGICRATDNDVWLLLGFIFSVGLLLLGLANDTRYKAFVARLKQLDQPLLVSYQGEAPASMLSIRDIAAERRTDCSRGREPAVQFAQLAPSRGAAAENARWTPPPLRGFTSFLRRFSAGWRPRLHSLAPPGNEKAQQGTAPARPHYRRASMPRTPWRLLRLGVHLSRKLCEIHVVMNAVTALIVAQYITRSLLPLETYLAVMGPLALFTSIATLARDIRRGGAEREFARWFTSPPNADDENHHLPEFNTSRAREPFDPTSVGR